jgi:quercetin dioxygenase-like cupin family protein
MTQEELMADTTAPMVSSPGIDQFSPAQLLRTARLFAADPELPSMVNPDNEESSWLELDSSPDLQIWLLSWPAGTHNEWHDHGESVGAFHVVRGTLLEQTSQRHRREFRTLIAGEGRSFEQNHLHHLANVRKGTALSVHVYAPRLSTTTRYEITPTGLQSSAGGIAVTSGTART